MPAPLIAYNNPLFEKDSPIPQERVVSDDYLHRLVERMGEAARLAQRAGFDGIDLKSCHRYLGSELLSAYNRPGDFGGSFENRTRFLRESVQAAKAAVTGDFLITSRLNVYDGFPYPLRLWGQHQGRPGAGPHRAFEIGGILHQELGLGLLDVTIGNPYVNPHVNRPADAQPYPLPESPLVGLGRMLACVKTIQQAYPSLAVVGSGLSYPRQFAGQLAAGALEQGCFQLAGFGRMAFAYPNFAKDMLSGKGLDSKQCCVACGKCSQLMRLGSMAGVWCGIPSTPPCTGKPSKKPHPNREKGAFPMKKTAIVTGARRGIGLAIAKKLLEGGYRVVLCATTAAGEVTTLLEELTRLGEAYYLRCDISRPEDRDNLLDQVLERFGRLDVLVNNAGVACKQRLSILETTPESFERLMKVNCEGTFFLCQGGANRMIACQRQNLEDYHPRIVNISSISAYTSSTNRGEYCISKAGISMITQLFADELASYGIPVFEVRPGIIATDMTAPVHEKYEKLIAQGVTPIRRFGQPEDVADCVWAACSGLLDFGTGTVLNADGGFHLRRL